MSLQLWLSSIWTRSEELLSRGADKEVVDRIRRVQINRALETNNSKAEVAEFYENAHPVEGGTNLAATLEGKRLVLGKSQKEGLGPLAIKVEPGARDISKFFCRQLDIMDMVGKVTSNIQRITDDASVRVRRKVSLEEYPVTMNDRRRALRYGAFKEYVRRSRVPVFKGIDMKLAALAATKLPNHLALILGRSERPIEDLKLLC
jgi:hypothetical protein